MKIVLIIVILFVFLACHVAKVRLARVDSNGDGQSQAAGQEQGRGQPRRIISMAPSVTETLFALGLGERVVGVSDYCKFPPEAAKIDRIGGVMDPNLEAVVALRPDLVIMLRGNTALCPSLRRFGIKSLVVDHKTVEGVLESIPTIGQACGNSEAAGRMVDDLRGRIDRVRRKTAGRRRPSVMVSVIRTQGAGRLEDIYAAGDDEYFDQMIEIAGGRNVFGDQPVRYPVVSNESIIKADPEIIIDIVPSMTGGASPEGNTTGEAPAEWRQLSDVSAVNADKVYSLDEDFITVPGPRFILLLEKLAKLLHPEVDWD